MVIPAMSIVAGISSHECKENKPIFSTIRLAFVIGKTFVVLLHWSNCEAMRILSYRTEAEFFSNTHPPPHEIAKHHSRGLIIEVLKDCGF